MKKIIILIILSFAVTLMAQDVKIDLQNALKKLKNCHVQTDKDALDLAISEDYIDKFKMYNAAVYYSCNNGYFTYIQDSFNGSFIRGEICKKNNTDEPMYGICPDSKSIIWFQFQIYSHNNTWGGWFNETDDIGMFIKSITTENTRTYGEKFMMDIYHTFATRRHK